MNIQVLNKKWHLTVVAFFFMLTSVSATPPPPPTTAGTSSAAGLCESTLSGNETATVRNEFLDSVVRDNKFHVARGWGEYESQFPGFTSLLLSLGSKGRWLDAGAGDVYAATEMLTSGKGSHYLAPDFVSDNLRELTNKQKAAMLTMAERPLSERPQITAVSFSVKRKIEPLQNLRVIQGRFFEDIPDAELGKFDVITIISEFSPMPRP